MIHHSVHTKVYVRNPDRDQMQILLKLKLDHNNFLRKVLQTSCDIKEIVRPGREVPLE